MGQNIYTDFWKKILQQIKDAFQKGQTNVQIDVRELADLGDRRSYSGNLTFRYGQVATYTDAAPYRDLIDAIKTTSVIKPYIDSEFAIVVNSALMLSANYNKISIQDLVNAYKKLVAADNNFPELYKWTLLGKQHFDLDAPDFHAMLKAIDFRNLIYMNARAVHLELAKNYPDELRKAFRELFNESVGLRERIVSFRSTVDLMYRRTEPKLASHQDERSIATYLTYQYPEKYSFYKESFYSKYCKVLELKSASVNEKYLHYLHLIKELIEGYIKPDLELQQQEKSFIPVYGFADPNFTLLAQDILYRTLEVKSDKEEDEGEAEDINYWLFQGNPKVYDFETGLRSDLITDWTVSAHKDKIKPGDKVIIWITGQNAGCYALAEITSSPNAREDSPDAHLWKEEETSDLKAGLTITHNLVEKPLLWSNIKNVNGLQGMKVGNQGTNFSSNKKEFETLLELTQAKTQSMKLRNPYPLNQILYGPPGTGKTFNSINYALAIIEDKPVEDIKAESILNRNAVKKRFDNLVVKDWDNPKGRIGFITFHQSMSYEDFIEGIKPVPPAKEGEQMTYEVIPGIFKRIVNLASVRTGNFENVIDDLKTATFEGRGAILTIKAPAAYSAPN